MPEHLVAGPIAAGKLVPLKIVDDPAPRDALTIYAAHRRDHVLGPAGRWLLEAFSNGSLESRGYVGLDRPEALAASPRERRRRREDDVHGRYHRAPKAPGCTSTDVEGSGTLVVSSVPSVSR